MTQADEVAELRAEVERLRSENSRQLALLTLQADQRYLLLEATLLNCYRDAMGIPQMQTINRAPHYEEVVEAVHALRCELDKLAELYRDLRAENERLHALLALSADEREKKAQLELGWCYAATLKEDRTPLYVRPEIAIEHVKRLRSDYDKLGDEYAVLQTENARLRAAYALSKSEREDRAEVQLAGCSVAALDPAKASEVKPGDYGYSQSLKDVLDMRTELDAKIQKLHAELQVRFNDHDLAIKRLIAATGIISAALYEPVRPPPPWQPGHWRNLATSWLRDTSVPLP